MPTYEVRNRRSQMVLGTVVADRHDDVLDELLAETGSTIEDLALSLGSTMTEVRQALDIVRLHETTMFDRASLRKPMKKLLPPRKRAFYQEKELE